MLDETNIIDVTDRVNLMRVGDFFAYDTLGCDDGDVLYGEVLELIKKFDPRVDRVGDGPAGCRVKMYCSADGDRDGVVDHYGWGYLRGQFVRLTPAEMEAARRAAWPQECAFLESRGIVFPSQE